MIDRQHGKIIFECDDCNDTFEPDGFIFGKAWVEVRDAGWTSRSIGGVWVHNCPDCAGKK